MRPFAALTFAAGIAGIGYLAFALQRLRAFERTALRFPERTPPVTILKPLRGATPQTLECLASFCAQTYPEFQIVFGLADANDPALAVVHELSRRFPERDMFVCTGGAYRAPNRKVANLVHMLAFAKHDVLVIADADIRVTAGYLHAVVADLETPNAGAVTCLYGTDAGTELPAQLAALHVEERFAPSVLVAQAVEPLRYAFGATIALRRSVLEEIGGFEALAQTVADDHRLGELVAATGRDVILSRCVVYTAASETGLRQLWARELRWARTIRSMRPAGWAGNLVSHSTALALLAWLVKPRCRRRQAGLAAVAALRGALHIAAASVFAGRGKRPLALVPLRDFIDLAIWVASFAGNTVEWGGETLHLEAGGRIQQ